MDDEAEEAGSTQAWAHGTLEANFGKLGPLWVTKPSLNLCNIAHHERERVRVLLCKQALRASGSMEMSYTR